MVVEADALKNKKDRYLDAINHIGLKIGMSRPLADILRAYGNVSFDSELMMNTELFI